jgi:hypothetical protein
MWYLAEILLVETPQRDAIDIACEACNVVFQAETAVEAYRKALDWGRSYASEPPTCMRFLGVSDLTTIGQDLRDGTEICGRFFRARNDASELATLVPAPESFKAIQWEGNQDTPLAEMLDSEQINLLKRAWGHNS